MMLGQSHSGATVNATLTTNSAGQTVYNFNNVFDMSVSLGGSTGIVADDTASGGNDQFLLQSSSSDTINGGPGNSTFVVAKGASDLGGDILKGGRGINVVQLQGSGTTVDLTQGSSGISAVVALNGLSGETVDIKTSGIATSALTGAGAGPGKAFAALIGADGAVNVTVGGAFQLMGELNAAGAGFSPTGAALNAAQTAALAAEATGIGDAQGTLAADSVGSSTKRQAALLGTLDAYVISNGAASYTIWTDGLVTLDGPNGATQAAYQPAASTVATPSLGAFDQFTKTGTWASGALNVNAAGQTTLSLSDGSAAAYAAVSVGGGVTGAVIRGDNGANGPDWFGLGGSGGGNFVYGGPAGNVFDLQNSGSLQDDLIGGAGFNVVRATAAGADVDLTANNGATSLAAKQIAAVVGSQGATKAGANQTVEVDPNTLSVSTLNGAKTAVFEALLGSSASVVTLEGRGDWIELGDFAPGAALPANAVALQGGSTLDALYGSKTHTAENALTGYLFEQVTAAGASLKYVTVYTDAALVSHLASPPAARMAQAMAQFADPGAPLILPASVTHAGASAAAPMLAPARA